MDRNAPGSGGRLRAKALATAGALWLVGLSAAQAGEWRYCYAYEPESRRFTMSAAFASGEPMGAVERTFRDRLAQDGIRTVSTGCPHGESRDAVAAMMRVAAAYNREDGRTVATLDWPRGDPMVAR